MAFFVNLESNKWPNGMIPYEIQNGDFNASQTLMIQQAIAHWNEHTIITIVPRNGEDDYVVFRTADGSCSSAAGKIGGEQFIGCDVGDGFSTGNVIHEIGHAVGLNHEQARPDRDSFVSVDFDNIIDEKEHNFDILQTGLMLTPYDYGSIMHYGRGGFAIDSSKDTLTPIPITTVSIGQRQGLSDRDIEGVCSYYQAPHFCVVWQDDQNNNNSSEIYWSLQTNWGKNCSPIKRVNGSTSGNQAMPDVGMDQGGSTVVVWHEDIQGNNDFRIKAKGIWPTGEERFAEICVNDTNYGSHLQPSVCISEDGSFLVVWLQRWDGGQRLLCRGYDASGRVTLAQFEVSGGELGTMGVPVIDKSANGDFVVAWGELNNESLSVHVKGFNASGNERWPKQTVAQGLGDQFVEPRIAVDGSGNFFVVWEKGVDDIQVRGYDASGNPSMNEMRVNKDTDGAQVLADVAIRPTGEFLVVWTDDSNENNMGQIYIRGFKPDGSSYLGTRTVNRRGGGFQSRPRIDINAEGVYYVVWQDDVDKNGLYQVHANGYLSDHRTMFTSRTINKIWKGQQWRPAVATR